MKKKAHDKNSEENKQLSIHHTQDLLNVLIDKIDFLSKEVNQIKGKEAVILDEDEQLHVLPQATLIPEPVVPPKPPASLEDMCRLLMSKINREFPNYILIKVGDDLCNAELDQAGLGVKGLLWGEKRIHCNLNILPDPSGFMANTRMEERFLCQPFIVDIFMPLDPVKCDMSFDEQFQKYKMLIAGRIKLYNQMNIPYITHYYLKNIEDEIRMIK